MLATVGGNFIFYCLDQYKNLPQKLVKVFIDIILCILLTLFKCLDVDFYILVQIVLKTHCVKIGKLVVETDFLWKNVT